MTSPAFQLDFDRARELPVRVEEGRTKLTEQRGRLDGSAAARGAGVPDAAAAITDFCTGMREFITQLTGRLEQDEGRLRQCYVNTADVEHTSAGSARSIADRLSPLPGKL